MSLSVFCNGFIQAADVLPKKAARTENDEASLGQCESELFCILPADSGDVIDGCVCRWVHGQHCRIICFAFHRRFGYQQVAFDKDPGFAFIADQLSSNRGERLRLENLQGHRGTRLRHRSQELDPSIMDCFAVLLPLLNRRKRFSVRVLQKRLNLAEILHHWDHRS